MAIPRRRAVSLRQMTLAEVEAEVRAMLDRLNRPCPGFEFDREPAGDATPHVEGDGPMFDWVISERGVVLARETVDAEDLLFLTLTSMTAAMAQGEELRTRTAHAVPAWRIDRRVRGPSGHRATQDDDYSRKTWMDAHARLMGHLRPHWAARIAKSYAETLRRYPLTPQEWRNARRLTLSEFGLD